MGDCLIRTGRLFQEGTIRLKIESLKRGLSVEAFQVADRVLPVAKNGKLFTEKYVGTMKTFVEKEHVTPFEPVRDWEKI